jgi:hypothetical protein
LEAPPKNKHRPAKDPVIPLLGIYVKECKSDYCNIIIIAKLWKQPRWPTTENVVFIYNGILFNYKKE